MRVSVEDHEPGEILRKLPEIVRELMQLDAGAIAEACTHHDHAHADEAALSKAWKPGEPDPLEQKFTHPVTLAMYRQAKAAAETQGIELAAEVSAYLSQIGRIG